jgi:hypothetical protein
MCQIDVTYNPSEDSEIELDFIRTVLERLANRSTDEYLLELDVGFIERFEKSLIELI